MNSTGLWTKTSQSIEKNGLLPTSLKIVRYPFNLFVRTLHEFRARGQEKEIFGHARIENRFTEIYKLNYWGSDESASGGGSTLSYTERLRKDLPTLFARFSVKSVFDAPCGDFNWMRHVLAQYPVDYVGGDIVLPLIASLNQTYANGRTRFIHIDLTRATFPAADLMICRDCLFHLSYEDTRAVLRNFCASDIAYLLTSTHKNTNSSNRDIQTGDFRFIDLFSAPYNFPADPLFRIPDWKEPGPEREMCLWSRAQIAAVLGND